MSDFFRILRGLEIDESMRIMYSLGIPSGTDADTAAVGSLCMNSITGDIYTKRIAGTGSDKWYSPDQPAILLYSELSSTPTPPSALGANSIAFGSGSQTTITATNALAIGDQSLARLPGGIVQANGRFASSGDAQVGRYILRGYTTNAFETELMIDGSGGSKRLVLPDDATWTFKITFTGHRTDDIDGHAGFYVTGVIYRVAGVSSVAMMGKANKDVISKSNRQWDVNVYADTTYGSLKVTATGQTSKTIRWVALVETVEVTN